MARWKVECSFLSGKKWCTGEPWDEKDLNKLKDAFKEQTIFSINANNNTTIINFNLVEHMVLTEIKEN